MRTPQRICGYIYILTFSLLVVFHSSAARAQTDTTTADTTTEHKVKKKDFAGHQLCLGVDFFHPILNSFYGDRYSYELAATYYMRNAYYFVGEGGYGGIKVDYPDLKYTSTNNFLRLGFDRCVLNRDSPRDWDMMLMGLRVGVADISRSAASYSIVDSTWGNAPGTSVSNNFPAVWMELTGGVRVEVAKGLMLGWNMRGKFLLNAKSFNKYEPAPLYIAGYGRGDKNSVFDFNMYVSYAIRWKRKSLGPIDAKTGMPIPPHAVPATNTAKDTEE